MNPKTFFGELKRRNVYRVAVTYAVIAWLLIQAASILLPTFEAPTWVMKALVALLIFGFVMAVFISWAFEATPQGMKRTEDVSPDEVLPSWSPRKFAALIVTIALLAASLLVFNLLRSRSKPPSPPPTGALDLPAKSIAVLPFENLSRDPDNAYFTEGIQDEILARLAKIADLKVISRTSTQRYKSSPDDLPQIAKRLGVSSILEGSVQKTADRVRVTVQLINAASDAHLWAETYDRNLTDVFAAESDIAKMIADTLRAKLAVKALELDNTLGEAHATLANALVAYDLNFAEANREFRRAIELNPNYATAHQWYGETGLVPLGQFDEAIAEARRALELDPLSIVINADVGTVLTNARRYDQAIDQLRKAVEMDPGFYYAHWTLGDALELKGHNAEAIAEYKKAIALNDDPLPPALLGHLYAKIGRKNEALAILKQVRELRESSKQRYVSPYNLALVHIGLGQKDEAIQLLEETYEERDGYNTAFIKVEPMLDPLRGDPRFEALVQKVFAGPR